MARTKTITIPAADAVKEVAGALVSFIRHPFGPSDPVDDPGYLELRERVLRAHGVWAPPGSSYRIGDFSELNPPVHRGNVE